MNDRISLRTETPQLHRVRSRYRCESDNDFGDRPGNRNVEDARGGSCRGQVAAHQKQDREKYQKDTGRTSMKALHRNLRVTLRFHALPLIAYITSATAYTTSSRF